MLSIVLFGLFSGLHAQKGNLKIFSELKGVSIYIDDVFRGIDISSFDSLPAGNHYIKATKDDVQIYGELVNVTHDQTTTVLIKDSKEVQDRLLARKFKEQEIYRSKKLDVLVDTKLVTETTGNTQISEKTKSLYFPGYYSILGGSNTSGNMATQSTTVTKSESSWFITRGNEKISQDQFAIIVNDTAYMRQMSEYKTKMANYEKVMSQKPKWKIEWTSTLIGAAFMAGGTLLYNPKVDMASNDDALFGKQFLNIMCISTGVTGAIAFLVGIFHHQKPYSTQPVFISPITMDEAIRMSKEYNRQMKLQLGLPEDYEPQK